MKVSRNLTRAPNAGLPGLIVAVAIATWAWPLSPAQAQVDPADAASDQIPLASTLSDQLDGILAGDFLAAQPSPNPIDTITAPTTTPNNASLTLAKV